MPKNLHYLEKDITTVEHGIIAHGCNCQGVMGSGVAYFLKQKYPQIFPRYNSICVEAKVNNREAELPGYVDFVTIRGRIENSKTHAELAVANCFTQHLYGRDDKYAIPEAIRFSLSTVLQIAAESNIDVYIPKIGAGRGGLVWATEVEPIIIELANLYPKVSIYVCSWKE